MGFSRETILHAIDVVAEGNPELDRLEIELNCELPGYTTQDRRNSLARIAIQDAPEGHGGNSITDVIVRRAVETLVLKRNKASRKRDHEREEAVSAHPLWHALCRDGFTLTQNDHLQLMLPKVVDISEADDEVHDLLDRFGFVKSRGHLDQALECHTRGHWAAANGQLRTFFESLLDEIAIRLDPSAANLATPANRRQRLASLVPPFLKAELNEWDDAGKNFTNGLLKRLHPNGAHPGLSDERDCTFRLQLVLLCGRLFLRRLRDRLSGA